MGVFETAYDVLPKQNHLIYVNDSRRDDLWCTDTTDGSHGASTRAHFEMQASLFDSNRDDLKDGFVLVYPLRTADGLENSTPSFAGYLSTEAADLAKTTDGNVRMVANSITGFFSAIWVGQTEGLPIKRYPFRDPITGNPTGWTPKKVLQDLIDNIPSQYGVRVRLGVTSVLSGAWNSTTPELTFNNCTYLSAIDQILALYGDVSYKEVFRGAKVNLDFYRVQDSSAATVFVRACQWNDPITAAANIHDIGSSSSSQPTRNRVIGYGSPRRFMISCKSAVPDATGTLEDLGEPVTLKQMQRVWEERYEDAVKANPKASKSGSQGYNILIRTDAGPSATTLAIKSGVEVPTGEVLQHRTGEKLLVTSYTPGTGQDGTLTVTRGYLGTGSLQDDILEKDTLTWLLPGIEYVFRRYHLPACLWPYVKLRENAMKRSNTQKTPYKVQVWKYPRLPNREPDGSVSSTLVSIPTLIKSSVDIDLEKNQIILSEPALNEVSRGPSVSGSAPAIVYEEAVIGVTFTFEHDKKYAFHDTGEVSTGDIRLDFASDGLTEQWQRAELIFSQFTNTGFPVLDANGNNQTFSCIYFDEDNDETPMQVSSASIIQNDIPTIRAICQEILREKNHRHRAYEVTIPYYTRAYEIGNRLVFQGLANIYPDNYMITSVTRGMDSKRDGGTFVKLRVDNIRPPYISEA